MGSKNIIRDRERERGREVVRVTWIGFWINVVLSVAKMFAGYFGNSRAVLADGVHSVSDLITDVAVLVGARFWVQPPDDDHAYGHKRLESLVSLLIGFLLGLAGIGIAYDAVSHIGAQKGERVGGVLALSVTLVSLVSKEILYRWTVSKARQVKSDVLEANAWHHRSDALSSLPVAVAVLVAMVFPSLAVVDLVGAVLVAVFILYAAWTICRGAVYILLDGAGDPSVREKIIARAMRVDGVKNVHQLRTRFIGQGLIIDMHACVDGHITVAEGNAIAHRIEECLYTAESEKFIGVEIFDVLVHIDPWEEYRDSALKN